MAEREIAANGEASHAERGADAVPNLNGVEATTAASETKGPPTIASESNTSSLEQATQQVHLAIRNLLTDEFPDLARKGGLGIELGGGGQYLRLTLTTMKNYFKWTWKTWWGVAFSFAKVFVGGISPIDFLIAWLFALAISVILTAGIIICIIAKFPLLGKAFDAYANRYGGVSFINIVNNQMFKEFSDEELRLAKEALSRAESPEENTMNIDVAKLLLLFSALVYERSTQRKREGIRRCSTMDWSQLALPDEQTVLLPNHKHPHFLRFFEHDDQEHNTSPTSITSSPVAQTARSVDSSPDARWGMGPSSFPARRPTRYGTFPADFSTWQRDYISPSLIARREGPANPQTRDALDAAETGTAQGPATTGPDGGSGSGQTREGAVASSNDSGVIYEAMQKWGFEYEPVSELDTSSSAYSAAFWDKNSNWVVVAFKGTSPPEFDEWLVDFDYTRVPVDRYIPGCQKVHHGIKNRLFPDEPTLNRTPYETIVLALKAITDDLLTRTPKGVVNVYLTGHSLGSGIASLAYARLMQNIDGLDSRVKIRDAYLFSSPISIDMPTVKFVNQETPTYERGPCSIWRLVNHHDAVATLFPAMGDDPRYPYPDSLFAFAHLGTEVKMRRKGTQSIVANNYAPNTATATAISGLPEDQIGVVPKKLKIPLWMEWAQYVPLAGWMFSHFPGLYFEALQSMGAGEMQWQRKHATD